MYIGSKSAAYFYVSILLYIFWSWLFANVYIYEHGIGYVQNQPNNQLIIWMNKQIDDWRNKKHILVYSEPNNLNYMHGQ